MLRYEATEAGYSCMELRRGGFVDGLKDAGFSIDEARGAGCAT